MTALLREKKMLSENTSQDLHGAKTPRITCTAAVRDAKQAVARETERIAQHCKSTQMVARSWSRLIALPLVVPPINFSDIAGSAETRQVLRTNLVI